MVRLMSKPLTINGEALLLCERLEMAQFVHVYLQYLFRQGISLPTVQLLNYRSLQQLEGLAKRLPNIPGSKQVQRVLIFADAQNDLENRRNKVLDMRSSDFFRTRDYCAHFLFPGRIAGRRWLGGYLEDLLVEALKRDTAEYGDFINMKNIAREYLMCIENNRGTGHKLSNYNRNLLYTYFAGTEKFVGCTIAEAAKLGAFDFEHVGFVELKKFILGLGQGV